MKQGKAISFMNDTDFNKDLKYIEDVLELSSEDVETLFNIKRYTLIYVIWVCSFFISIAGIVIGGIGTIISLSCDKAFLSSFFVPLGVCSVAILAIVVLAVMVIPTDDKFVDNQRERVRNKLYKKNILANNNVNSNYNITIELCQFAVLNRQKHEMQQIIKHSTKLQKVSKYLNDDIKNSISTNQFDKIKDMHNKELNKFNHSMYLLVKPKIAITKRNANRYQVQSLMSKDILQKQRVQKGNEIIAELTELH